MGVDVRPVQVCCIGLVLMVGALAEHQSAFAGCLPISSDSALQIAPEVEAGMAKAKLGDVDLYNIMRIVARYETNGCWGGATGNFDKQWLSVGVMQWNLGTGHLQPLLARFRLKFSPEALNQELDRLMPNYGRSLFDRSCTALRIEAKCKSFLQSQYVGQDESLSDQFKVELDRLFESNVMRQIQVDYFGRSLTTVLDDLGRVFGETAPQAWQVAWAMDLKTQQGRFPSDMAIKNIRENLRKSQPEDRKGQLLGIILWYEGSCKSGYVAGVRYDCDYNVDTWNGQVNGNLAPAREETVHFTYVVSHSAGNEDGLYQADSFQRRATIAFGKGSVHGTHIDFSQ